MNVSDKYYTDTVEGLRERVGFLLAELDEARRLADARGWSRKEYAALLAQEATVQPREPLDARFCPGCGHSDWPTNCPTACVVGARFRELRTCRKCGEAERFTQEVCANV